MPSRRAGKIVTGTQRQNNTNSKVKILIADGHPVVRRALVKLIKQNTDLVVCLQADNTHEALDTLKKQHIDLAIADISLKGRDTGALAEKIKLQCPNLPVLILSMEDEALYAESVSVTNQKEYVVKKNATERIIKAIQYIRTLLNNHFFGFTVLVRVESSTAEDADFAQKTLSGCR